MVAGIVVIGKNLTIEGFRAIRKKYRISPVVFQKPLESAYPRCFEEGNSYMEGILAQVYSSNMDEWELEHGLKSYLVDIAKKLEIDYCKSRQEGREWCKANGLDYDFPAYFEDIATQDIGGEGKVIWKPHFQIIETCPEDKIYEKYLLIASRVILYL